MSSLPLSYRGAKGAIGVDVDRLVASRMLVQANSGGGKSRALRQLLEETHGTVQHLVLDTEGEFPSLREKFDYVLAGKEGDVPATPKTARLLCRRLVELSASAVIDLYDLSLQERREYVRLFLTELMALPRALWRPILVVIDEAHVYVPERGSGESQATEAVITLCTQGRKRGYCAVLATQRISKLHKDAAAELLNKLIGRTGLDVDMKRAGDELGLDKDARRSLARLAPGEFYAYGPAIANEIQVVRTGAVQTTHPEAGRLGAAPPPAPTKVRALLAQFADLPKEAEEEAQTVEDLRRQLRDSHAKVRKLEKTGAVIEKPVADPQAIAAAVEKARGQWTGELRRLVSKDMVMLGRALDNLKGESVQLEARVATASAAYLALDVDLNPDAKLGKAPPIEAPAVATRSAYVPPAPPRTAAPVEPAEGLSRPQQRMLNALASLTALGLARVPRGTVAVLSDQSPRSSGFEKNMGTLRSRGLIRYPDADSMALTDDGSRVGQADATVTSRADLHAAWSEKLSGPQWKMCKALISVYPDAMDRGALAAESGQSLTSSGFEKNLGTLRSLGLVDYPSPTEAVATTMLFPEGL
jgi:hypothetical protein